MHKSPLIFFANIALFFGDFSQEGYRPKQQEIFIFFIFIFFYFIWDFE